MKVLMTDGHTLHALAAIRGLGKAGHEVIVAIPASKMNTVVRPLAMQSKYCKNSQRLKADDFNYDLKSDSWQARLQKLIEQNNIGCLMPLKGDTFSKIIMSGFDKGCNIKSLLPSKEAFEIAYDKKKSFEWLAQNGFPIPKSNIMKLINDNYPLIVIKPTVAQGSKGLKYVRPAHYFTDHSDQYNYFDGNHIFQEYIPGENYGFFAIYREGKLHSHFMHKRIRQYPITGGPSACAMSVKEPGLLDIGRQVFDRLDWNGVGMVECVRDNRTGEFKIIEINPKFWGSLDLAIHAGVNFPDLYCRLANGENVRPVTSYREITFRWLFPNDFMHMLAKFGFSAGFWKDFFGDVKTDIEISDLFPNLLQPFYALGFFARYGIHWRYPNGKIPKITG